MKKYIFALLLISAVALGASTYTSHYSLEKPNDGSSNWGTAIRNSFDTIDTQLYVNSTGLNDHITDTVDAHDSTAISTPGGPSLCTSSITVEAYLDCLDSNVGPVLNGGVVTLAGAQTVTGLKTFSSLLTANGGLTASGTITFTPFSTGLLHSNGSGIISSSLLVDADIDASAAISRSKVASGTASHVLINDGSGNLSSEARLSLSRFSTGTAGLPLVGAGASDSAYGTIADAAISVGANIARGKIASGTADHVIINDGTGALSSEAQLSSTRGGTGVSNAGTLTYGSNNITLTTSGATGLTLPTTGTIATLAGSETLTNKVLSGNTASSLINGSGTLNINSSGTITVPNVTDTLVGKATTDTLTNKTISTASNTIGSGSATASQVLTADGLGNTSWSDPAGGAGSGFNVLKTNPDFESGISSGWTNSGGTFSAVSSGSNLLFGNGSATFDASAASQYIESSLYTIPNGLLGRNCLARIFYKGGDTNLKLQVIDGSSVTVAERTFESASTDTTVFTQNFVCPSSGSFKLRVASAADAAIVAIDRMFLGEADNLTQLSQATMLGGVKWVATASCSWTRASTTFGSFSADADCTTPVGSNLIGQASAPSTKIPAIKFASLPPGEYMFIATGIMYATGAANVNHEFRFHDGTNALDGVAKTFLQASGDEFGISNLIGRVKYTTTQSNITIELQNRDASGGASTGAVRVDGSNFNIFVYKYPSDQEQAFKPDQIAWMVDANISGANPDLGTVDVSSYTGVENGSLTLTQNSGSIAAQIPCSSTNSPTGTTCSVGNESVGVSFTVPAAGYVEACAEFSNYIEVGTVAGGELNNVFQMVETPNNAQTISQEGKSRIQSSHFQNNNGVATLTTNPLNVCGTFYFSSAGQKTLRLMYELDAGGTLTSASNIINADASTAKGQRDIHFVVKPINQAVPAPLLIGSVTSSSSGLERIERATIAEYGATCSSSPCTITSQSGSWISSVTRSGTGIYSVNINSGIFSSRPSCNITVMDYTGGTIVIPYYGSGSSSTLIPVIFTDQAGVNRDTAFHLICMGAR